MMKLIIAIVNHDDSGKVTRSLTKNGFSVTKLSTTGGFLMRGNTTLLIGVENDRVDAALEVIRSEAHSRSQLVNPMGDPSLPDLLPSMPAEVIVGGATIFVVDVEQFVKL